MESKKSQGKCVHFDLIPTLNLQSDRMSLGTSGTQRSKCFLAGLPSEHLVMPILTLQTPGLCRLTTLSNVMFAVWQVITANGLPSLLALVQGHRLPPFLSEANGNPSSMSYLHSDRCIRRDWQCRVLCLWWIAVSGCSAGSLWWHLCYWIIIDNIPVKGQASYRHDQDKIVKISWLGNKYE